MKIAVLVRNPNAGGGIQIFARELANKLPHDIEMYLVSRKNAELLPGYALNSISYFKNFRFSLRSFDLILMHQFSIKFYIVARLARRPIVVVNHIWDLSKKDFKSKCLRGIKKLFLKYEKMNLVFVSESVRKNMGLAGDVIPNRSTFTWDSENCDNEMRDLLFVGRFIKEKGVFEFVEIVKHLRHILPRPLTATMIGEGPEIENLKNLIIELGLEMVIDLVPWMDRESLKEMYLAHRILIVPSIWDEPYGLVAAEGLSLGLKVFCSDRPGLIEATLNQAIYFDPLSISSIMHPLAQELKKKQVLRTNMNIKNELDFHKTVEDYSALFHRIQNN